MSDAIEELRVGVERLHGGSATFLENVMVREEHAGEFVWEGVVRVFKMTGAPAARAYAWVHADATGKEHVVAVLGLGPVDGPVAAVRAAIVAESRRAK